MLYNCVKGVLLDPNLAIINGEETIVALKPFLPWNLEFNKEYFFEIERNSDYYLTIIDLVKIN